MTREEAINVLNDYDINFERNTAEEVAEAHEMAIKALQQQPNENEKIIRISKGTLKARTGRYVVYDVEWLKEHFNTTEAKIYGQPKAEGTRGGIPLQQSVPKMPQLKTEEQQKTGHWIEHKHGGIEHIECSECRCWFLRKDLIRNSYCPNCGSRNHWEWELKMQEVKK